MLARPNQINLKCHILPKTEELYKDLLAAFHHCDQRVVEGINCSTLMKQISKNLKYGCFVIKNERWGPSTFDYGGLNYDVSHWKLNDDMYKIYIIFGVNNGIKAKY